MIGVQASGKGTQAGLLAKKLTIPQISTGDIFRGLDKQSELGKKVNIYMEKGELVPDDIVMEVIKERLSKDDVQNGAIADGFPRNLAQAKLLDTFWKVDTVICIRISDEEAIKRITGRRICTNSACNAIYNINTAPHPKVEGKCDNCGSDLMQRTDETESAVRERIETFHEETEPVIDHYAKKGIVVEIDGAKSIEDVHQEIITQLGLISE